MKELEYINSHQSEFLKYWKSKFPLYHDSNVFFRDLHYGVMSYTEERLKRKLKYLEGEPLALQVAQELEKRGILKKIDGQTWLLNYPEFALPRPALAVKPAAVSPAEAK